MSGLVRCTSTVGWMLLVVASLCGNVHADEEPKADPRESGAVADDPLAKEVAALAAAAKEASMAGHNAWLLTSSALVLFMTAPGLAMFYGGLVRKKNVLGVFMQCLFLMGLMTVIWGLWGYSLAFGGDHPWFGNGQFVFLREVGRVWNPSTNLIETPMEGGIPRLTHMLFQGMFFIITPALICGAFAERMKFSAMVVFSIAWGTVVYCPLCHWVWDGGVLAFGKPHSLAGGALDFAGGTVVHISSGVSALVCALVIGKRLGYGMEPMPPHNLTYTTLGAAMLWVGWFGFNAGSALLSDGAAASAFATTHFAAAGGVLAWAGMEWMTRGKPSVLGASSGAVAGLVCVTPAAGFVQPMAALAMGISAGIVCFMACTSLKSRFGYDDSLDAFGVHGTGGTLGAILTGVFATRACADLLEHQPIGLIEGNRQTIIGQLVATAITWGLSIVITFVLLKLIDATIGLRVTQEQEMRGLDLSQHGEEGYIHL